MSRYGYCPAGRPALYFTGVTTGQLSIMRVFPHWAEALGLYDSEILGIDLPLHAPSRDYCRIVSHIRKDPLSRGALVTTHKIDLLAARRDLFDRPDPCAELMDEVSCISKSGEHLIGHAGDPITCRRRHCPGPEDHDVLMAQLADGSVVVNATGLGKDGPPVADHRSGSVSPARRRSLLSRIELNPLG